MTKDNCIQCGELVELYNGYCNSCLMGDADSIY